MGAVGKVLKKTSNPDRKEGGKGIRRYYVVLLCSILMLLKYLLSIRSSRVLCCLTSPPWPPCSIPPYSPCKENIVSGTELGTTEQQWKTHCVRMRG